MLSVRVSVFWGSRAYGAEGFDSRSRGSVFSLNAKKPTVARSGRGSDSPPGCHSLPRPFESLSNSAEKSTPLGCFFSGIGIRFAVARARFSTFRKARAPLVAAAGKQSPGLFAYTRRFESLSNSAEKSTPLGCFFSGIGIRTPTNRVRVCRATVTQFRCANGIITNMPRFVNTYN